jgi:hypothetical protein
MTLARVWTGTLLAPLAWAADLAGKLFLERTVNATQRKLPLHLLTVVALALVATAFWLAHRQWRETNELLSSSPDGDRGTAAATRSVARWGMALALFFALLVAAMDIPTFVFAPRDLP